MINAKRQNFLDISGSIFTFILSWVSCGSSMLIILGRHWSYTILTVHLQLKTNKQYVKSNKR